jgi:hypothetical protein
MRRHLGKQRQAGLLPGPGSKDSYQGYTAAPSVRQVSRRLAIRGTGPRGGPGAHRGVGSRTFESPLAIDREPAIKHFDISGCPRHILSSPYWRGSPGVFIAHCNIRPLARRTRPSDARKLRRSGSVVQGRVSQRNAQPD